MWLGFTTLLFVFSVGIAVGGLFATSRMQPRPILLISCATLFMFCCYFGMLAGVLLLNWLSGRFVDFLIVIIVLVFIIGAVKHFHPNWGFIHLENKIVPLLLLTLFCLMGLEWGVSGFRGFFTFFAVILFTCGLLAGLILQRQLHSLLRRYPFFPFAPLIWLLFVTVLKLL